MATVTFDTHKFIRRLRDSGIPDEQAEALADALRDVQSEAELATKRDIQDLEMRIREVELPLTIKIGGMLVIAVGVLAALLKLQ